MIFLSEFILANFFLMTQYPQLTIIDCFFQYFFFAVLVPVIFNDNKKVAYLFHVKHYHMLPNLLIPYMA